MSHPEDEQYAEQPEYLGQLQGSARSQVVGIRYYQGRVNANEMVAVVRDPTNAYDSNAIQVNNVQGVKVGHLPRTVAQFLAPPMDQGVLQIEGLVPSGTGNAYKMPVWLALWAEPQHAAAVQQAVRHAGLSLGAAPGARGGGGGGGGGGGASGSAAPAAPSPRKPPAHELAAAVERVFASIELGGPRAWCEPHHSVATTLFTHQKEALAWMITRENSNALPPFWEAQPGRGGGAPQYVHALTNFTAPARPAPMRGGLLADDMGLGKTLQTIALIATNRPGAAHPQMLAAPPEEEEEEQEQEAAGGSGQGSGRPAKKPKKEAAEAAAAAAAAEPPPSPPAAGGPRGTLIVCPLSVLPGWEMQLEEHVAPGALRCLTYHGPARERSAATLSSQDVVLTTYATLAAEVGAKNGATRVHWLRVVADEAHTVKNPATQAAKALAALRADRRWAITGTPIMNGLKDFGGLLSFLRLDPLADASLFRRTIERPFKLGEAGAVRRLQALVGSLALRRTKAQRRGGRALVALPPRAVEVVQVELEGAAREKYESWEGAGRAVVEGHLQNNTLLQNYTAVLEILLRLRQICSDPSLVAGDPAFAAAAPAPAAPPALTPEVAAQLVAVLREGMQEECPVCLSDMAVPVITLCRHVFCRRCIEAVIAVNRPACPLCRAAISAAELLEAPPEEEADDDADGAEDDADANASEAGAAAHGAKIAALLARMRAADVAPSSSAPAKHVIFSQFHKTMDLVGAALEAEGVRYCRIDGKTPAARRGAVLREFQSPGGPAAIIVSLKAAGVGINLSAANYCHMLDPWWNASSEEQAADRLWRLGQRRPVTVCRYLVARSIEGRMVAMQEAKRELMNAAFQARGSGDVRQRRIDDVRLLMAL